MGDGTGAVGVPSELDEWRRIESAVSAARWFGVVFAVFQLAVYDAPDAPGYVLPVGYALAALLAVATATGMVVLRRVSTARQARRLAWTMLLFDATLLAAYVGLYTFDDSSSLYLVFFVLPAEAALKFQARGALAAWVACTAFYTFRELWAADRYGHLFEASSISFRMGILFLVSVILGLFARKLDERTRELGDAVTALEHQERWRQALIDMLAHDLRAPVGAAASSMMVLRDRSEELQPVQVRQLAAGAVRQNERALRLTQDLLDLARSQQGRLELQRTEVPVEPLLRRVVDAVAPTPGSVDVVVEPGLRAEVDPARCEQVVANLVANATKHGRPPVEVTARGDADGTLELRVTDNGPGVPEAERPTLFTPFAAGGSEDSVGLGLWVVRTLVESHGGTVAYAPVRGRPSFVVRLPGAGRPAETERAGAGRGGASSADRPRADQLPSRAPSSSSSTEPRM